MNRVISNSYAISGIYALDITYLWDYLFLRTNSSLSLGASSIHFLKSFRPCY
nr:MAG TPA: hypothetical protein [Caudoviricetes sp.]